MPATIVRSPQHRGLVLLESSVNTEPDGFIQVRAKFLAPEDNSTADFVIDSPWPLREPPKNIPPNQGGPYLHQWQTKFENGLVYIDATYVTALAPIRVLTSRSTERRSFSGRDEITQFSGTVFSSGPAGGAGPTPGTLVTFVETLTFDYMANTATNRYAVVAPNRTYLPPTAPVPGPRFNERRQGSTRNLVRATVVATSEGSAEKVGRVRRVSITTSRVYEQNVTGAVGRRTIKDASFLLA